ncbi:MAG: serine hydroxymethyltransferase [Candidatus Blackburnbacteria bacterium]|nr:serine hydroxymethyltransferase [Candidatus Blackburnbacteria bacterium]
MDKHLQELITREEKRQENTLTLIPSENYASRAVREAVGSVLSNKYSEGYPGRRYYQGNDLVDEVERLAIERAKKLFNVPHANVQPYSGSPANSAVLFALCEPGDTIMGMELASGGHLTHGQPKITFSGKYFRSVQFGVEGDGTIDYKKVQALAKAEKPRVIIIGTTAYPLALDWKLFGEIADSVGAYLVADIAHVVGLIIGNVYPSPFPYAHIVTTTTHKTLRGPRGAMIMVTEKGLGKYGKLGEDIDRAVFPGLQGGPHNNTTAGIAQALFEADTPEFKKYAKQVVANAKVLAQALQEGSSLARRPLARLKLIGGGTESHLMLVDLRPNGLSGNVVAEALEKARIVCNKNSIPGDTSPFYPSGIRLGTPAVTTRGMGETEMTKIAEWIIKAVGEVENEKLPEDKDGKQAFLKEFKVRIKGNKVLQEIAGKVKDLCQKFPVP